MDTLNLDGISFGTSEVGMSASLSVSGVSVGIGGLQPAIEGGVASLQSKSVNPSESEQLIEPDDGYDGLSDVTVGAISSTYVGSGITSRSSSDLSANDDTISVPAGYYASAASKAVASMTLPTAASSTGTGTNKATIAASTSTQYINIPTGYNASAAKYTLSAMPAMTLPTSASSTSSGTSKATINPSESNQYINIPTGYNSAGAYYLIAAVSNTYVGSGITRRSSTDLGASGDTVSVPAGYYESAVSKAVASGSATTPATTITANPSITVGSDGKITAMVSKSQNVAPTVSAGYVSSGTAGAIGVTGSATSQLSTQAAATITPSTSQQTAVASGKYTTGAVVVSAMPSGTAGTPSCTKGSVSNHAISVTPSVTNQTGYITGGTKTGAAVSVAASELVSGTLNISQNGEQDVTTYQKVNVSVSGGGPSLQSKSKSYTPSESQQSETVSADSGYDGLSSVSITVGAISSTYVGSGVSRQSAQTIYPSTSDQSISSGKYLTGAQTIKAVTTTNLTADNIKSGVTVTVGDSSDADRVASVTGTYSGGGGGSLSYDTKTVTASNYPVSLDFTSMKGEPKFFSLRLNAQVSSSGSTTYYYIVNITSNCNGSSATTHGNCFRIGSTRRIDNITSGYSYSYSGTTFTITSSAASRSASPGAFYSGSYELMYAY